MCQVGFILSLNIFPTQFFLGLRSAEQIGRQLGAAHVIENVLALFQALALMNVLGRQAAVKPHVTVILKNGIVNWLHDTGALGGIGKLKIVFW